MTIGSVVAGLPQSAYYVPLLSKMEWPMRTKVLLGFLFLAMFFTKPVQAQEGVVFSPSVLFYNYDEKENGTISKVDALYYDVRLGYVSNGLYVGALYSVMKREDGDTSRERTSTGASLGFMVNNFYLIGHYIFDSTYNVSDTSKMTGGTGIQGNIGYWFNVSGPFFVGPEFIYRAIDYKKRDGAPAQSGKTTETLPYVSFGFIF